MGMNKHTPNRARFFVRKKYTTFSTKRIVALRSVNKKFPESYDFAAKRFTDLCVPESVEKRGVTTMLDLQGMHCMIFLREMYTKMSRQCI
jgi:hypothetical protein